MKTNMFLKSKKDLFDAYAIYEDGNVIVCPGSRICLDFYEHTKNRKEVLCYKFNPIYVDKEGVVIKECFFSSPSTAAQFVTGQSRNGLLAWHIGTKVSLKKWLQRY